MGLDYHWEQEEANALKQDFLYHLRRSKDTYCKEKIALASTSRNVFEMER